MTTPKDNSQAEALVFLAMDSTQLHVPVSVGKRFDWNKIQQFCYPRQQYSYLQVYAPHFFEYNFSPYDILQLERCNNYEMVTTRTISLQWISPPKGTFMINSDGSYRQDRGGYGGIIRDNDGSPIVAYAAAVAPVSVIFHELQGILKGLQIARERGMEDIVIATDCTMANDCVRGTNTVKKEVEKTILDEICVLLRKFKTWSSKHVYREINCVADCLSKYCQNLSEEMVIQPADLPEYIKDFVVKDRSGHVYSRTR